MVGLMTGLQATGGVLMVDGEGKDGECRLRQI